RARVLRGRGCRGHRGAAARSVLTRSPGEFPPMYSAIAKNKRNTIFIIAIFLVILGGLGALAGWLFDNWWIAVGVLAFAALYATLQYFTAARQTLLLTGAQSIEKQDNPRLYRIVEN